MTQTPRPAVLPVPRDELDQLVRGEHGHPHVVLGPHPHDGAVTVRVLRPLASSVTVSGEWGETPLDHEHEGVWVGVLPVAEVPAYQLAVSYEGEPWDSDDPYRFLPTLGEMDLHLINEGRHEQLWTVLGAHVHHYDAPGTPGGSVSGTSFAVWAPSARGVRVKADFNSWDGREHPMRQLGHLGGLGAVRARRRQRHVVQVRGAGRRRAVARQGRPDGRLGREAVEHRLARLRVLLHLGRRRLDDRARREAAGHLAR